MLWTERPRRTSGYTWVENMVRCGGTLWTDLHGVPDIIHRTVDRYFELFAYFLRMNLESHPREPVWDMLYYQKVCQVLVGYRFGA